MQTQSQRHRPRPQDSKPNNSQRWKPKNHTNNSKPNRKNSRTNTHQNLTDSDGIGDTTYTLDARNEDRFPLKGPLNLFDVGAWNGTSYSVYVASNSTISNFYLNKTQRTVSFNVAGPDNLVGFCRVTVPNVIVQGLWQNNYTVLVDGIPQTTNNWTDTTYTYIYFTYLHSQHEIVIIPEFPSTVILPLLMILTLIIARKRLILRLLVV